MTADSKYKVMTSELVNALLNDLPECVKEAEQIARKLEGFLQLLTMAQQEGFDVPEETITDLQRLVRGRKGWTRRVAKPAARGKTGEER